MKQHCDHAIAILVHVHVYVLARVPVFVVLARSSPCTRVHTYSSVLGYRVVRYPFTAAERAPNLRGRLKSRHCRAYAPHSKNKSRRIEFYRNKSTGNNNKKSTTLVRNPTKTEQPVLFLTKLRPHQSARSTPLI